MNNLTGIISFLFWKWAQNGSNIIILSKRKEPIKRFCSTGYIQVIWSPCSEFHTNDKMTSRTKLLIRKSTNYGWIIPLMVHTEYISCHLHIIKLILKHTSNGMLNLKHLWWCHISLNFTKFKQFHRTLIYLFMFSKQNFSLGRPILSWMYTAITMTTTTSNDVRMYKYFKIIL